LRVGHVFSRAAVVLVLAALTWAPSARAGGDPPASVQAPSGRRVLIAREGDSFLEEISGQRVLHLAGDPYALGLAHGRLLKQETRETTDAYLRDFALGVAHHTLASLREVYSKAKPYIPQEYQDEMRGLADGSGVPLEDIQLVHIIPELHHCSGAAVYGKMTRDGKLYHYRSLDYALELGTKKKVQENACLIVRKPKKGCPTVVVGWAGTLGCVTGMNASGISIGEMGSDSKAETLEGTPMWFRVRWILENSRTLEEGLAGFREWKRTCGYNFIITDGKIPDARAVECDRDRIAFFAPGGAEEDHPPHKAIPSAVRRSNHFVDPELASRQRAVYDPRESEPRSWAGYARITDFLEKNAGTLDGEGMISLCRTYPKEHSCLHQAVFCPSDLRFWVANAKDPATCALPGAQNQTFYPYDLRALLATDPAALEESGRLERAIRDLREMRERLSTVTPPGDEFADALERLADTLEHAGDSPAGRRAGSEVEAARGLLADMKRSREKSQLLAEKIDRLGDALDAIAKKVESFGLPKEPLPLDGKEPESADADHLIARLLGGKPTGVATVPALPPGPAAADEVTARALDFLKAPAAGFPYRLEEKLRLESYAKHAVRFPSAAHTTDESDLVSGFYYEPLVLARGSRAPGVVVVHHLGGGFEAEEIMAAYFAQHGLAAMTISLPGYGPRRAPEQPRAGFVGHADPKDDLLGMRQAVLDVCRAAYVLRARSEVDPARVGVLGVSLGAIVAADAAGFDPTFQRAVFVIGGGDLYSVLSHDSPETRGQLDRAHKLGYTDELLRTTFQSIDPVTFAARLRSEDCLMLNAERDEIIPRECTLALWRKAGYPRIKWYACGHYGIVAHLPDALNESLDHLVGTAPRREPD
jgi:dienelactone hydrolase